MKYVITESRLEESIIQYFNELFPIDDINYSHPWDYNSETEEEGDDENRIEFFLGDYEGGDNDIFRWYGCNYFDEGVEVECPIVQLEYEYYYKLTSYFGDKWIGPFKTWFKQNIPFVEIKSVNTDY